MKAQGRDDWGTSIIIFCGGPMGSPVQEMLKLRMAPIKENPKH